MSEQAAGWNSEQLHLEMLLAKCKGENNPEKLLCHFQAVKTLLVAHLLQQSTLQHQLRDGQIIDGKVEDSLLEDCEHCVGAAKKTVSGLHKLLRKFENDKKLDSMEFRVQSTKVLKDFDKSMDKFKKLFDSLEALRA